MPCSPQPHVRRQVTALECRVEPGLISRSPRANGPNPDIENDTQPSHRETSPGAEMRAGVELKPLPLVRVMNKTTPSLANGVVLKQMLKPIPRGMINRHALETGMEAKARSFSVVSYFLAMLCAQLSPSMRLNDVCDWLRLKSGVLALRCHASIEERPLQRQQGARSSAPLGR